VSGNSAQLLIKKYDKKIQKNLVKAFVKYKIYFSDCRAAKEWLIGYNLDSKNPTWAFFGLSGAIFFYFSKLSYLCSIKVSHQASIRF